MSLVPDYADSSEETDEDDLSPAEAESPIVVRLDNAMRLPMPGFINNEETRNEIPTTSVFTNPFIEAEIAKKAILEKHVKMVNTRDNTATINGKKICWNYRKGRCRFGHNCKYAHDSDLQKTKEQLEFENQIQRTVICQSEDAPAFHGGEKKKRKRPGLTQGLVPGKKVMKSYNNQKKVT